MAWSSSRSVMRANLDRLSGGGIVAGSTPGGGTKDGLGCGAAADAEEEEALPEDPLLRLDCHKASAAGSRTCRYARPQKVGHSSKACGPEACGKGPATSACK